MAQRPTKRARLESADEEAEIAQVLGHHFGNIYISGQANVQMGDRYGNRGQDSPTMVTDANIDKYDVLLKSLLFDRIDFRVNNVKKALLSTCNWLLQHPNFQNWYTGATSDEHNGFFWMKGKPGCGKSTLMKAALEWARRRGTSSRKRQTIVPYFFNARATASLEKSVLGLYRTVVRHLLSSYEFLRPMFMNKFALKDAGPSGEHWTIEELQEFLCDSVESGHSFELCLFIDALDEAEHESDVRSMVSFLIQLADRSFAAGGSCQLRICLSSRHYPNISISRGVSLVVEDQPEHSQDIETYIKKQLTCVDGPEKTELKARILKKSAHVFLWVVLVVGILNRLEDHGAPLLDMQARLETIPADLNELFRDILLRSDDGAETSVSFFRWMVFAMRPLEPAELFVAIEYSRSPTDLAWAAPIAILPPPPKRLARYILNCSRGLVEVVQMVKGQPQVVQFIHETVRDFLLKDNGLASIVPALATNLSGISHEILRIACQRCISANAIPNEYQRYCEATHEDNASLALFKASMRSKLPFLDYAILFLFEHAEQAQRHKIPQQTFLKSQMDKNGLWVDQYRLWWNVLEHYEFKKISSDLPLLHFVFDRQFLSLIRVLPNFLDTVNKTIRYSRTVLQEASSRGDTQMVQLLLEMGADANTLGGYNEHENALYIASGKGYTQILQLLLDRGAEVNTQTGGYNGTALQAASAEGHIQVIQLLLDRGAEVNTQRGLYGTALQAASYRGHTQVVQLLLDRGAEVNTQGGYYSTVLQAASAEGHIQVVQLLLDRGAEVNTQTGGLYGTALQAASAEGHIQVVQLLLDRGAEVNIQAGGHHGTALQAASAKGHTRVVQLLLSRGAEVNTQIGAHYGTVLYQASAEGHIQVVQLLLDRGAEVNTQGGFYGTALQAASYRGYTQVVQLLLDRGAEVNTQRGLYDTALQAASAEGHTQTVQLLLDRGAEVNTQGGLHDTALQAASAEGHIQVVQLLLDMGAEVNTQGGLYGAVLQAASAKGHTQIVQLLRKYGAKT